MLKRSLFILVAVATLFQVSAASAELKIGVYDNRKILESLPSVQKEFKKLNAEFEPKQKQISSKQTELLKLKDNIEKNAPVLDASELNTKQLEFQSKRRELQLLAEDTERIFKVRQNELARKLQSSVDAEVIKLAEEESFDLILRSGVLYAGPKVDITDRILKRMSKK